MPGKHSWLSAAHSDPAHSCFSRVGGYNRAISMRDRPFLPRRRSVRLKDFDYATPAAYFLTICTQNNKTLFGKVTESGVTLNDLGRIVEECWREIPIHFPNVELAVHVVMPNHIHGILILRERTVGTHGAENGEATAKHLRRARHAVPLQTARAFASPIAASIPTIVGAFKSASARRIQRAARQSQSPIWQRGYYEHVIRDEEDFRNTSEYIRRNPARWNWDVQNPADLPTA